MAPKKKKKQTKSNDELAAEYAAKLAEHDEQQREKAKVFDPKQLMQRADRIVTVEGHPVLGTFKFGELTFEDAFEIDKCKDEVEKTEVIAWLMMRKAYPDLPRDFLKRMPLIEGAALIDFLTKQPAFLSAPKSSANGSGSTRKRKTSA